MVKLSSCDRIKYFALKVFLLIQFLIISSSDTTFCSSTLSIPNKIFQFKNGLNRILQKGKCHHFPLYITEKIQTVLSIAGNTAMKS